MKLAMSQIAWQPEEEEAALAMLRRLGYAGVEIAPPRVAGPTPYEHPEKAAAFARVMADKGLAVCSMQSIWFGQTGSLFGPQREELLEYTKKAILFSRAAECKNLVFGCPKNRVLPDGASEESAIPFFKELGDFAHQNGAVLALEANPPLYGTNFINRTAQALQYVQKVASPGFMVNLDVGTMVELGEKVDVLRGKVAQLHHVHISEPNLAMIEKRPLHTALAQLLEEEGYAGYVSVEMKAQPPHRVQAAAEYVAEVFG